MPTTDIEDHNDIRLADGVTAYHGSPHEFEEFDPAFIGTGEGAQAYGHGLYFAENEDVAKGYRDRLADRSSSFRVDNIDMPKWVLRKIENHSDRQQAINEVRNDFQKRLSEFEEEAKGSHQPWMASGKISMAKDVLSGLDKIESGSKLPNTKGRMYEVRIDAHPEEHLLDWDKPLNEQHLSIQKAIKNVISSAKEDAFNPNALSGNFQGSDSTQYGNPEEHDHLTGAALHDMISRVYGHADQSKELSKRGIRGIRYKDAGSRGIDGGSGSHNYVIFDPQHIKTVRRYAGGGGIKAFAIGNSIPHLEQASDMIDTHDDIQLAPGVEAIDEMPDQAFTSEGTSRNQIPALFNSPAFERKRGSRNLDYGGGAFDKGSEYLAQEHGVDSQVYDPFNREKEHNDFVLKGFKKEPADTATVANVLNVIAEPEARLHVIKQVHNHIKPDGKAYFTVYEGDGKNKNSGNSQMTRDGWQEHRPTHSYVEEIKKVFPDVRLSGKIIIASKKPAKAYGGSITGPKLTEDNVDEFARRLILWSYAAAPLFNRSVSRADGGQINYPDNPAADLAGRYSDQDPVKTAVDTARQINPMGFYSAAAEAASKFPQKAPIDQIINKIKGQPNVKKEELDNANLADAFAGQRSVDPKEVARHLQASVPQISETVYGQYKYKPEKMSIPSFNKFEDAEEVHRVHGPKDRADMFIGMHGTSGEPEYIVYDASGRPHSLHENFDEAVSAANEHLGAEALSTQYSQYTIPGGENYREIIMNIPVKSINKTEFSVSGALPSKFDSREEAENYVEQLRQVAESNPALAKKLAKFPINITSQNVTINSKPIYKSSHWNGVDNPLAHLRMSDRDDGKTLHLEELQSDWGQAGREEGFYDPNREKTDSILTQMSRDVSSAVPKAPYVTSTDQWVDLGLKRALMEAAKGGYDKLIWTPGEEQAERYKLSKHVKALAYDPEEKTLSYLPHTDPNYRGYINIPGDVEPHEIKKHIGKEMAKRLLATEPHKLSGNHILEGLDLEVGKEGMQDFYDKLVPQRLNKLVAQYDKDAKVAPHSHSLKGESGEVKAHAIQITPKLREAILKGGLPAFDRGGAIIDRAFEVLSKLPQ